MIDSARDDRFAPPFAPVQDVAPPHEGLELATRGSRFWAAVIDVIIIMSLVGLASWLTPWNPFKPTGRSLLEPEFTNSAVGFVLFLLTQGYLLTRRGQTIGKALLKIRIVRPDGARVSAGRLIGLRYGLSSVLNIIPALGQVFGLLDALWIFSKSRRCLHDRIADTLVVKV